MSLEETKKIEAIFILEIIGRPAEHLTETLKNIIEKMKKEKGVTVKDSKINEPVPLKDKGDFFTNFAEIELEMEDPLRLLLMIFAYMPAHVEITRPESIKFTNDGLGGILNELTRRLHGYDEIARVLQIEKNILEKKLKSVLGEKGNTNPQSDLHKKEPKKEEKK